MLSHQILHHFVCFLKVFDKKSAYDANMILCVKLFRTLVVVDGNPIMMSKVNDDETRDHGLQFAI